jgi:hypothetical protein
LAPKKKILDGEKEKKKKKKKKTKEKEKIRTKKEKKEKKERTKKEEKKRKKKKDEHKTQKGAVVRDLAHYIRIGQCVPRYTIYDETKSFVWRLASWSVGLGPRRRSHAQEPTKRRSRGSRRGDAGVRLRGPERTGACRDAGAAASADGRSRETRGSHAARWSNPQRLRRPGVVSLGSYRTERWKIFVIHKFGVYNPFFVFFGVFVGRTGCSL